MSAPVEMAAFDFDGTLTWCDSFPLFLLYAAGLTGFLRRVPQLLRLWFSYRRKRRSYDDVKQAVIQLFFTGDSVNRLQNKATAFARTVLPRLLRPAVMDCLRAHQRAGRLCVIVSASLEIYLQPWADQYAASAAVLGSRLEAMGDRLTGRLDGLNCAGPEKFRRLEAFGRAHQARVSYAYGNSSHDVAMLKMADHAFYKMKPYAA